VAYDDPYEPLPMPAPYDDPWSQLHDDPWSRLPQRDHGIEEQPASSYLPSSSYDDLYDYWNGMAPGVPPQHKDLIDAARTKRDWRGLLEDVLDSIKVKRQPPYQMNHSSGEMGRLPSSGYGTETWRPDVERPGRLDTIGLLYLQQLASRMAGEMTQRGQPLRSYYRPERGEGQR